MKTNEDHKYQIFATLDVVNSNGFSDFLIIVRDLQQVTELNQKCSPSAEFVCVYLKTQLLLTKVYSVCVCIAAFIHCLDHLKTLISNFIIHKRFYM